MRSFCNIIIIISLIITGSCRHGEKKGILIPAKELIPILTDLYLGDGLLAYPPVRIQFSAKDSIINYMDIIEKHGYTKESMDATLKYYFVNNPKKLQKIYDQVLARLSEIQSDIETQHPHSGFTNLWNQKLSLGTPEDGAHNQLFFNIPVSDTGVYSLSFNYIIFKDDQSLNPRTTVYFWYSDDTSEGVRDMWERADLTRDGTRQSLLLSKRLTDTLVTHISGYLHDCDPHPGNWVKHSKFTNIIVTKGALTE